LKLLSFPHLSFWRLEVIAGNDINEEVKLVKLSDGHGDVIPLEKKIRPQSQNERLKPHVTNAHRKGGNLKKDDAQ